ncbi:MAG: hypothetical protein ABL999_17900 [Pyrinomonadaceae bacterium]
MKLLQESDKKGVIVVGGTSSLMWHACCDDNDGLTFFAVTG